MTFEFALGVLEFTDMLRASKNYAVADQTVRSGCSVGANVKEAQDYINNQTRSQMNRHTGTLTDWLI